MSLREKTVKGIYWSVLSQFLRTLLILGITAVLARLLKPSDFGLIAMAMVFENVFLLLNDMGLNSGIIYKKELTEGHLSSGFWVNIAEGFLLTLILSAVAPLIARFYSKPQLTVIVVVMSTTLFISSFGMLQRAVLSKALDFRTLAVAEVSATVLSGIAAVTAAAVGLGVWSLVVQSVSLSGFTAAALFVACKWKPKMVFEWKPLKELLVYGLPLQGFGFLTYFSRNMDNLLIGKYLGSAPLGDYSMAYRFCLFPWGNVSVVISRVMFPAISTIQEEHPRVRNAYIQTNKYIALITFPLMTGLIVIAPQFVRVILGSKWTGAIVPIQVLAAVGMLQSISSTMNLIYQTQGRTMLMFLWGVVSSVVIVASFVVGLHWGIVGVAAAYLIVTTALFYPQMAIPFRLIGLRFRRFIGGLTPVILATAGMATLVGGLRALLQSVGASDLVVLVSGVTLGTAAYVGLIAVIDRGIFTGLRNIWRDLRSAPTPELELAAELMEIEPEPEKKF